MVKVTFNITELSQSPLFLTPPLPHLLLLLPCRIRTALATQMIILRVSMNATLLRISVPRQAITLLRNRVQQ